MEVSRSTMTGLDSTLAREQQALMFNMAMVMAKSNDQTTIEIEKTIRTFQQFMRNMQEAFAELNARNRRLETELTQSEQRYRELQTTHQAEVRALQRIIAQLNERATLTDNTIEALSRQVDSLNRQVNNVSSSHDTLASKFEKHYHGIDDRIIGRHMETNGPGIR